MRIFSWRRILMFLAFVGLTVGLWFLLPILQAPDWVYWAIVIPLWSIWLLVELILILRNRARNKALEQAIVGDDVVDGHRKAEDEELRRKQAQIMDTVRRTLRLRGERDYLYRRPWYILIGPPGAGKTTILKRSKLERIATTAEDAGGRSGTLNSEWWFLDEAVLVDTAGRFTTQSSDAERDRSGWMALLDLLKSVRPRQPINGVLLVASVQDLLTWSDEERLENARRMRERLAELLEAFQVRLPVYVMVTKVDLLPGFTDFFGDLEEAERHQALGFTVPVGESAIANFEAEYDGIVKNLSERVADRLYETGSIEARNRVLGFPAHMASLRDNLLALLDLVFNKGVLDTRNVLLRGAYLTSGVQEGRPIDRLVGALRERFAGGVFRRHGEQSAQQSFFLTQIFREVIFKEAGLGGSNKRAERRRSALWWTTAVMALLLTAVGAAGTYYTFHEDQAYIDQVEAAHTELQEGLSAFLAQPVTNGNVLPALTWLDRILALPPGIDPAEVGDLRLAGFGYRPSSTLEQRQETLYRNALSHILYPRLLLLVEERMQDPFAETFERYDALKLYLMLGGYGSPDEDFAREWFTDALTATLGRSFSQVEPHLNALIDSGLWIEIADREDYPLDEQHIANARQQIVGQSLDEWAFDRMVLELEDAGLPDWTLNTVPNPRVGAVFSVSDVRAGTVPGRFTAIGFRNAVGPVLVEVINEIRSEQWILGDAFPETAYDTLDVRLIARYEEAYTAEWREALSALRLERAESLPELEALLDNLSEEGNAPMDALLEDIVANVSLSEELDLGGEEGGLTGQDLRGAGAVARAAGVRVPGLSRVNRVTRAAGAGGSGDDEDTGPPPSIDVARNFRNLVQFVQEDDGPAGLKFIFDQLINDIQQIRQERLNAVDSQALVRLNQLVEEDTLPSPVSGWVDDILNDSRTRLLDDEVARINALWQRGPEALCQRVINRYPITSGGEPVDLDAFQRFFGPRGAIQEFINEALAPHVDFRDDGWREITEVAPQLNRDALTAVARARQVQEAFFASGFLQVQFTFEPQAYERDGTTFTLSVLGTPISYRQEDNRQTTVTWPSPTGVSEIRLTMFEEEEPEPPPPIIVSFDATTGAPITAQPPTPTEPTVTETNVFTRDGVWALYQFMEGANANLGGTDTGFSMRFAARGITLRMGGQASESFQRGFAALRALTCPSRF